MRGRGKGRARKGRERKRLRKGRGTRGGEGEGMVDMRKEGEKAFSIYFNVVSFILAKLPCFILNENLN